MHRAVILSLVLPFAAASVAVLGAGTAAQADPPPISAELLTQRHAFSDAVSMRVTQDLEGLPQQVVEIDDGTHLAVARFTIQPGVVFPWHTHPGTVLITITQGDFVFLFAEDCVQRQYSAGDALVDPGDTVHTSYNPSADQETVVVATFIGVPAEGDLTLPVEQAEGARLDEACGVNRDDVTAMHDH